MRWLILLMILVQSHYLVAHNKLDSLKNIVDKKEGVEKVTVLNNLSFYSWNNSPKNGIDYGNQALELAIKLNDINGKARALQNIGVNYWAKGNFNKANSFLFQSMRIFEETGDKRGMKSCLNNIGIIYNTTGKYEKAIENFIEAKEIAKALKDVISQVNHNNNIGESYIRMCKYEDALKYLNENLELRKKHDVSEIISSSLSNIGTCLIELGKINESIPYFKEGLSLEIKLKNIHQASASANGLGFAYLQQKNFILALKFLEQAEELAIESAALVQLRAVQKNMAEYFSVIKDYQQALDYKNKFIATNDSIYNETSNKQIEEIRIGYESEQKEKENELLRLDNQIQMLEIEKQINLRNSFIGISILVILLITILFSRYRLKQKANSLLSQKNELIKNQSDELKKSNKKLHEQYDELKLLNATKDKFFMIVSHDLKGPFNSILGFSKLLSEEYNNTNDTERMEFIDAISKSSESAFNLVENLLVWAQTQTGSIVLAKEVRNLKELVHESIEPYRLNALKKNIRIDLKIPENIALLIDKNTSISFIGNLFNNAIKFTPEGGEICINGNDLKEKVELKIKDNGVGMSPETLDKLFRIEENISTRGTSNEQGTGLGLIISKEFIEINGGTILVKSELKKGSEFTITLPKKGTIS